MTATPTATLGVILPAAPSLIHYKPIEPTIALDWRQVGLGAFSEAGGIALDRFARDAPCGRAKSAAFALATASHTLAGVKATGAAWGLTVLAVSSAPATGGASLTELLPAVAFTMAAQSSFGNAIDSAFASGTPQCR